MDGYEPQARLDDEFYIKLDELRKTMEKSQNYARTGLLRNWLDMEIYR